MNTAISPQALLQLHSELLRWSHRWRVDPADLQALIDDAATVMNFNAIVGDDRSVVSTTIPTPARADLIAIIAIIANAAVTDTHQLPVCKIRP